MAGTINIPIAGSSVPKALAENGEEQNKGPDVLCRPILGPEFKSDFISFLFHLLWKL